MTISILILALVAFYLIHCYVFNKNITSIKITIIFGLLIANIINICFHLKPNNTFDLARYYVEIDYFRKLNFNEVMNIATEKVNVLFYMLEYLIACISKNNSMIFIFTVPITVGIFYYILINIKKEYELTNRQIVISVFLFFSIITTVHLMSGIRNALAVSLFALGLFLNHFKNKKIGYLFYVLAITIHSMVIIFIIFDIVSKLVKKVKIGPFLLIIWSFSAQILLSLLTLITKMVSLNFLDLYTYKFKMELETKFATDYRILIFEVLQVILLVYIMNRSMVKAKENDNKIKFFYYLGYFIIGSIPLINIFIRSRFMFAYFTPFILGYANKNIVINKRSENLLLIVTIIINIYYIYFMYSNGNFI